MNGYYFTPYLIDANINDNSIIVNYVKNLIK